MKKISLILLITLLTVIFPNKIAAQYAGTTWAERIGTGKDSVQNYSDYLKWNNTYVDGMGKILNKIKEDYDNRPADDTLTYDGYKFNYEKYDRMWNIDSYRVWMNLMKNAPFVDYRLYAGDYGPDMLTYLIRTSDDQAMKLLYFDELMRMSRFRVDNLDKINSLVGTDAGIVKVSTIADVKSWLAHYYYTEGKNVHPKMYDKKQAYQYYVDAMKAVRDQSDVNGTEVEPYLLEEYFSTCHDLYETDPDKYLEQFLQDYLDVSSTCKRLYETAVNIQDSILAQGQFYKYYNCYLSISRKFRTTGADNVTKLEKYYREAFNDHKEDYAYLSNALSLMMQYKCLPNADFMSQSERYSRAVYAQEEFRNRYVAMAYALTKKKESDEAFSDDERNSLRKEMQTAFSEAERLATNNTERADIYYLIGRSLNEDLPDEFKNDPSEIEKWANNLDGASVNLNKSRDTDRARFGVAVCRYIGDMYYQVVRRYYEYIYALPKNGQGNKDLLPTYQTMVEIGNNVMKYYNSINEDAHFAFNNKVYEQDGINIMNYAQGNINRNIQATKQYLTWAQNRIKALQPRSSSNANAPLDPTHIAYHDAKVKKLREKSFWTNKTETWKCEYCGRTFDSN